MLPIRTGITHYITHSLDRAASTRFLRPKSNTGMRCSVGERVSIFMCSGVYVAAAGLCVVSVEGRGSGGCAPGNFFRFPPQNNGVFERFRVQEGLQRRKTRCRKID